MQRVFSSENLDRTNEKISILYINEMILNFNELLLEVKTSSGVVSSVVFSLSAGHRFNMR